MRFSLLLCIFLSGCSSCKQPPDGRRAVPSASVAPNAARAELRIDRTDGFADINVPAQLMSSTGQSATIRTTATYRGKPIDIEVVFTQTGSTDLGQVDPGSKGILLGQGTVELSSIDGRGDALLDVLAAEYDAGGARRMKRSITVPITILGGSVANISAVPLKSKAFFDDGDSESYAELYVNFDPVLHVLQVHEKDEDYRRNVLRALSE